MKKNSFHLALLLMLFSLTGCGLFAPSDEDVSAAIDPALSASMPSRAEIKNAVSELQYQDFAELSYGDQFETATQHITIELDRDEKYISVDGVCILNALYDESTGYSMSGTIKYTLGGYIENRSSTSTEMVFDVTYQGGPVKSISFSANDRTFQGQELPVIWVNGKKHEFDGHVFSQAFTFFGKGFQMM